MYPFSEEPCCMAVVTSGGRDEHEPGCYNEYRPHRETGVVDVGAGPHTGGNTTPQEDR